MQKHHDDSNKALRLMPFVIVSIILFFCYYSINRSYPFYFIWDMDHQVLLDLLQVNSSMLPSNLTHPGFGIKFLLYLTHKTAYALKYISVSGFKDLYESVSPLVCVAELTEFYRRHSPVLAFLTVLLLWSSLNIIFKPKWWISLFVLIFLGFQESLLYHSSMIRSELYCVFYWSCAVFFTSCATKQHNSLRRNTYLILAGIFVGLSLLTKVQAIMYIFFVAPFFVSNQFCCTQYKDTERVTGNNKPSAHYFYLCVVNTAVFFLLMFMGFVFKMPTAVETLNQQPYGFTKVSIVFFAIWGFYLLYNLLAFYIPKLNTPERKPLLLINLIVTGFICSFLLHFLIYSDTSLSFNYLLSDTKSLFFNPQQIMANSHMVNLTKLTEQIVYNPFLFAVNAAVTAVLALGYLMKFIEIQKRQIVMLFLLLALTYTNTVFATRFMLRDYLWVEIMVNFVSIYLALIIMSNIKKHIKPVLFFLIVIFLILFTKNICQCVKVPVRINANYGQYGWKVMLGHVYDRIGEKNYAAIMDLHYLIKTKNNRFSYDIQNALNYEDNKRIASFIFPCSKVNTRYLGFIDQMEHVWKDSFDYIIIGFPEVLKNALTIDPAFVLSQTTCRLKPDTVSTDEFGGPFVEYQDKINGKPKAGILPVFVRRDLDVILFVHKEDEAALTSINLVPINIKIVLSDGKNQLELHGLEIKKYSEIDVSKIKYKYLFVIKELYPYNYSPLKMFPKADKD
ncbi:MAG: hypothetical protein HQK88_10675 [Nitrospirae bacterium]|nr:hypothetical protein [Nitrospirota bacterium]MBF0535314.1 hypothetical protein [Nitrospirota bacterium]MBF0617263.1 hypothetical protein [Nitrospirota bacterium]